MMKTKALLFGLFLLTFVSGIYLIPEKQNGLAIKTDEPRAVEPKVFENAETTTPKNENPDVVSYETAKKFGGAELLDENYREKEIKYRYDFLNTGEFHGDEITAKSGEKWLGLYKQNDEFDLSFTKINVQKVHDVIVDENDNQKTGKNISVSSKIEPLFLIKNASKLKLGKVKTHFGIANKDETDENSSPITFSTKSPYEFQLNNQNYSLKVEKVFNRNSEIVFALILEKNETKQIIHVSIEDYLGSLYWLGDLDNDNKPDFYLSPWIKENISENSLYISSEADKKNLVKKVASMTSVGC